MTAQDSKEKSKKKLIVILIIVIAALLIAGGVALALVLNNGKEEADTPDEGLIKYDEAAVALTSDDFRDKLEKEIEKAKEGQVALKYNYQAYSDDGKHFICSLGNSEANNYDMYFNIYTNESYDEQILLTGLFKPGTGLTEFDSDITLSPGQHDVILVFTLVDDDHKTIKGQTKVTYEMIVERDTNNN